MKLIYIEWEDAMCVTSGWSDRDSVIKWAESDEHIVRQAGFLIKETKKYIVLAGQHNPQEDEDRYSVLHKIPKTWIRKRKTITI